MPRSIWRTGILALALLIPSAAQADPKDDARRHFAAGLQAIQDGDYEIALQRFLAAQEAYPHPATLYNIAQCYMDMGDTSNAYTYYKLYLDAAPDKAQVIDPILAAIEARQGAGPVTPTTGPTPGTATAGTSGGAVSVVVTGPTAEELARLQELTTEFEAQIDALKDGADSKLPLARMEGMRAEYEALFAAIEERRAADLEAAQATQGAEGTAMGPDEGETGSAGVPDIPDGSGFIEGAYDKIVVTASRVGQDPLDSPSTLTVLTSDDIRMSGAQNISDLLRRVVGVGVMNTSAGNPDVSIRGFQRKVANKVLFLIDGRSTYSDFAGLTSIVGLPVSLEEIDRVEVIRGPGSAVYGANAVTGVVNIITKTPGEHEERLVKVEGGSPGLGRATAFVNGSAGNTSYRLAGGFQRHGRWQKELTDDITSAETFYDDQDTAQRVVRANGRIDQKFGDKGFASLSAGMSDAEFEMYNLGALPNYGVSLVHTYLRGDIAWGGLHLRAFWNADTGETGPWIEQIGQARTLDSFVDNDAVDVELEGPIEFSTGSVDHTLNLGVGYRYKRIDFPNYFDNTIFQEHHFNGFVNEQLAIGKLGVVASLRVDRHPLLQLQETISPRTALLYRVFDKTSLRATYGTAFRSPNALETYMDFNLNNPAADGVFIRDVGDSQTLSPERITTLEVGVHDESTFLHTADVVVYMNQVRKLIDLSPINPEVNAFDPDANGVEFGQTGWVNLDDTYTGMGIEAELELYPTDGLDVYTNLDLQTLTVSSDGQTTQDQSVAPVKWNVGTMYRTPFRVDFTYDIHYVGPQTWRLRGFDAAGAIAFTDVDLDPRLLMTARVAARPFEDDRLEVSATAWNFTQLAEDAGFKEHPEGQAVGGRLFGGLTYNF